MSTGVSSLYLSRAARYPPPVSFGGLSGLVCLVWSGWWQSDPRCPTACLPHKDLHYLSQHVLCSLRRTGKAQLSSAQLSSAPSLRARTPSLQALPLTLPVIKATERKAEIGRLQRKRISRVRNKSVHPPTANLQPPLLQRPTSINNGLGISSHCSGGGQVKGLLYSLLWGAFGLLTKVLLLQNRSPVCFSKTQPSKKQRGWLLQTMNPTRC